MSVSEVLVYARIPTFDSKRLVHTLTVNGGD